MARRTHTIRTLAGVGVFALAAALTSAAVIVTDDVRVTFNGTDNRFAIVAAAGAGASWTPADEDWADASENPIVVELGADGEPEPIGPDDPIELSVAIKNASALDGILSLRIDGPPAGSGDPDFFDQLEIVVTDGGTTIIDSTGGSAGGAAYTWPAPLAQDESRVLRVRITVPANLPAEFNTAQTQVRFRFDGVSA